MMFQSLGIFLALHKFFFIMADFFLLFQGAKSCLLVGNVFLIFHFLLKLLVTFSICEKIFSAPAIYVCMERFY